MDVSSRQDVFWSGKDGLRLHARRHLPDRVTPTGTVVCIPGLTRNAADFEAIAGVWERRTSEVAQTVVIGLYPSWDVSDDGVAAADAFKLAVADES